MLLSASSLSLLGCGGDASTAKNIPAVQTINVDVMSVELGTIPLKSVVPGSIVSDQKAQISSRLVGYIKNFDLKVGQNVKRGELLFSIDSADIENGIAQARSGYQQAKAGLLDAKLDYKRFKKLYEDESVSKQNFDKMNLKYKIAKEQMITAKTGLNQAKSQLKYANVKAPFDGVVVKKMATAGDLSAPGKPILSLENKKTLSVKTQVSHELYAALRLGDTASIVLDGIEQPLLGTIYTMVAAADPKNRTHIIKLSLHENSVVNSGTFARISFTRGERQTLMVPKSAVISRSGIEGVFVVENETAFFNMVRLGEVIGEMVEIKSGINFEDSIVVSNNESLLNGDKLIVTLLETTSK